jgi:CelD/BcsL family acetyltransferase involved in cellulose biosynthesis
MYHASVERWERPLFTYRDSLFSLLAAGADLGIRLWLVELDGEPCAGTVVLVHHRHATAWHGATLPRRCPGAMNLLDWELLQVLVDEGIWTYDLSGSAGLSGVVKYKESLGAARVPVLAYQGRHPLERAASSARRLLARRR